MLLDRKSIGLNTSFLSPQKESSSDCQRPHKVLRKKPHPTVRDLPKSTKRILIHLSKNTLCAPTGTPFTSPTQKSICLL